MAQSRFGVGKERNIISERSDDDVVPEGKKKTEKKEGSPQREFE